MCSFIHGHYNLRWGHYIWVHPSNGPTRAPELRHPRRVHARTVEGAGSLRPHRQARQLQRGFGRRLGWCLQVSFWNGYLIALNKGALVACWPHSCKIPLWADYAKYSDLEPKIDRPIIKFGIRRANFGQYEHAGQNVQVLQVKAFFPVQLMQIWILIDLHVFLFFIIYNKIETFWSIFKCLGQFWYCCRNIYLNPE